MILYLIKHICICMTHPIQFTDRAIEAINRYKKTLHIAENHFLRVGIRQKNETNKRLLIGFDTKNVKDKLEEIQGIEVIYTPGEVFFFAGMVIDYVENEQRMGFTFMEQKRQQE
jgi:iron-sulfur cluster assembly protein